MAPTMRCSGDEVRVPPHVQAVARDVRSRGIKDGSRIFVPEDVDEIHCSEGEERSGSLARRHQTLRLTLERWQIRINDGYHCAALVACFLQRL